LSVKAIQVAWNAPGSCQRTLKGRLIVQRLPLDQPMRTRHFVFLHTRLQVILSRGEKREVGDYETAERLWAWLDQVQPTLGCTPRQRLADGMDEGYRDVWCCLDAKAFGLPDAPDVRSLVDLAYSQQPPLYLLEPPASVLKADAARIKRERWFAENQEALESSNEYVREFGVPLGPWRRGIDREPGARFILASHWDGLQRRVAEMAARRTHSLLEGVDAEKWLREWIVRPQPALGGQVPACLLCDHREESFAQVLRALGEAGSLPSTM
jgi:hypothetical protein